MGVIKAGGTLLLIFDGDSTGAVAFLAGFFFFSKLLLAFSYFVDYSDCRSRAVTTSG